MYIIIIKTFRAKPDLLKALYQATIESTVIWYNSLCFFNSLRIVDAAKLHRVVKTASRLTGPEVTDGDTHYQRKVLGLMKLILWTMDSRPRLQSHKCQKGCSPWKRGLADTVRPFFPQPSDCTTIILVCKTTYRCFLLELLSFTAAAAALCLYSVCMCVCGGGGGVRAWGGGGGGEAGVLQTYVAILLLLFFFFCHS